MKKSHNDYWCDPQIELALREGCDIVEVDVISSFFRPLVSHSWRPMRRMCFGDLESYLKKAAQYLCRVQIDLKTGNWIAGEKIMKLIQEYPCAVYVTGKDNWFSRGRERLRDEIIEKTKAQPMPDNIHSVDLYEKPEKWWWQ